MSNDNSYISDNEQEDLELEKILWLQARDNRIDNVFSQWMNVQNDIDESQFILASNKRSEEHTSELQSH